MEKIVEKIIEFGAYAPSGENVQPWRVVINNPYEFLLYNLPDVDSSIYNTNQTGSHIALGAFLENILIGAHSLGYEVEIRMFPSSDKNHIASVYIKKSDLNYDEDSHLAKYIKSRCTNRKPQEKDLSSMKINQLESALKPARDNEANLQIRLSTTKEIAQAFSLNDQLTFSKRELHKFFFDHLRWSQKDVEKHVTGMYIKTLELPLPIQKLLKILKYWRIMNGLNKIGISKQIAGEACKLYENSGAFGAILTSGDSPKDFIDAGRVLERVWIKATSMGLNFHPLGGIALLMYLAETPNKKLLFSDNEIALLNSARESLSNLFNVTNKKILFFFRVGKGATPSAYSPKSRLKDTIHLTSHLHE